MTNQEIEKLKVIIAELQKDIDTTESLSTLELVTIAIKIRKLEIEQERNDPRRKV